jgi:hypothetical protein
MIKGIRLIYLREWLMLERGKAECPMFRTEAETLLGTRFGLVRRRRSVGHLRLSSSR